MALVRITEELRDSVDRQFRINRGVELNDMPNPETIIKAIAEDTELLAELDIKAWGELYDLEPRLNQFNKTATYRLIYEGKDKHGVNRHYRVLCHNREVPIFCPLEYGYVDYTYSLTDHPVIEQVIEASVNREEIVRRWETLSHQVSGFLRSCKSLNEALKLYPDLRKHIPQGYLDRVDMVTDRTAKKQAEVSQAVEALKAVDVDLLAASTVLVRMAKNETP